MLYYTVSVTLDEPAISALLDAIAWTPAGLVSCVAQQHDTGEVLMVAWMDRAAVRETLVTGRVCYFSRSRNRLWRKGETSGQVQRLVELRLDCDGDALLALVDQVGAAFLLHAGPYDPGARPTEVQGWIDAEAWGRHDHGHDHGHGHAHGHAHHHDPNRHDARIHGFCLTFDKPLPLTGLATWLQMMVATRGQSLLRVKGLLNLEGAGRPVVLHAVQHVFHPTVQLAAWPDGDDRRSRLVFIPRDLPRAAVEESLRAFLAAAEPASAI
jgi:phosphoribosyl-AMP cyclohydrolase